MKTFKDLEFKVKDGLLQFSLIKKQAHLFFDNGYGISVISGFGTRTDWNNPYEVAVLKGNKNMHEIYHNARIGNSVIGYCNEEKVTEIMAQIQLLTK